MDGTAKPDNEAVYYAIDTIQTAIHERRAISFQYFEYTPEKEKVLKHKGYRYGFSPYALIWNQATMRWAGRKSTANWPSSGWTA